MISYLTLHISVFTNFILTGQIVGRMLQDANIDFLYYFGGLSLTQKQEAIRDFTEKSNIRVLVSENPVSLK
jgi:SNF2 family DNA or RNA helicase